ncbi:unnamed protein product [Phytophthora fragariaefolia]|uniref:Unnamed protein product n=1 Tax=Phytophthora fragariaefolia TaxID=1490495 RepID=A0A9W6X9T7_9STRA|nr:unnamed protein product [Phytophthora fragariaefolia]
MRKMFETQRLLRKLAVLCEVATADNYNPTSSIGNPPSTLVNTARTLVHAKQLVLYETGVTGITNILQLSSFNSDSRRLVEASNQAFLRLITSKTTGQLHEKLGRRQRCKASAIHSNAMKWSLYMAHRTKMPTAGWNVDISADKCGYRYYIKMGHCYHLLEARILIGDRTYLDGRCCDRLKDRRARKKRSVQTEDDQETLSMSTPSRSYTRDSTSVSIIPKYSGRSFRYPPVQYEEQQGYHQLSVLEHQTEATLPTASLHATGWENQHAREVSPAEAPAAPAASQ